MAKVETSLVRIQYVQESRTRATWGNPHGLRRFVIGAERQPSGDTLAETRLSFSTLDPLKASLCQRAIPSAARAGLVLRVKHQKTRYFDDELLHVEMVKEKASA